MPPVQSNRTIPISVQNRCPVLLLRIPHLLLLLLFNLLRMLPLQTGFVDDTAANHFFTMVKNKQTAPG